ncbi:hypothetical protein DVH05_016577 [Phytophthora capsici]|nr:hypothetical protein DVH05_016577 [Phytophthora capsici]
MERLKSSLEALDLNTTRRLANGGDFLVEQHIPLETWNRYVARSTLPPNLHLNQLVWAGESVWLVEFTISGQHESAASSCESMLVGQLGRLLACKRTMTLFTPNQPTFEADNTFLPMSTVPGIQFPTGIEPRQWVTVIVEILNTQSWDSAHAKVNVYRQRAGVEYIICIKMSDDLDHWSYEVYDVRNRIPAHGNMAARHEFNITTVNVPHVVVLETWRVLGLSPPAAGAAPGVGLPPLPDGRVCPATVQIDVVDVATRVGLSFP